MKASLFRLASVLVLVGACDLDPGSIGDETQGSSESNGDDTAGGDGACGGETCGGNEQCIAPTGQCDVGPELPGTCQPTGLDCATIYAPVCGCDNQTYGNECTAHAAGVNVLHDGECGGGTSDSTTSTTGNDSGGDDSGDDSDSTTGGSTGGSDTGSGADCDGFAGLECPEGEFCYHDTGVCLTIGDALGECRTIPDACILLLDPVCGCDGSTYGNACEAHTQGVSVASEAECGATAQEKCVESDGTWEPTTCGHYQCGLPNECAAVIPGCDCGPGRNFYDQVGCMDDESCP